MLNTKFKSFKSIAYFNKKYYEISEKDFKSKWTILFFFPFSYTFVCPTELKEISEKKNNFKELKCNIFAISNDSHFTHKNWIEKELNFINFPFISDFNHNISKNNNILNKIDGNCERCTIILDPNLIIKSIDIFDNSIGRSINEIINRMQMLQYTNLNKNEVCPYNWNYNKKSIKINS